MKLFSKHLEANFKCLLRMELESDVIFLVLSSVNNDLFIYIFVTSVSCEIRYVGTAELKNIPYISARVTCTINVSVKETWMLKLKIWMLSFLEGANDRFFDKRIHTLKQWIIKKSVLEDMKTYVLWYFWTIYWWHCHILSLTFPLIWFMINVILWIQKPQVFVLRLLWYYQFNHFWLLKIFYLLKLSLNN